MSLTNLFSDIADAIREKDGSTDPIAASSFPAAIRAIPEGRIPAGMLDPKEIYKSTRPADWLAMPEPQNNEMFLLFHIPDGVSALLAFKVTCTGSYTVATGTVENGAFVQSGASNIASGKKYEAELFADDFGSLTGDGMKQCMVKISGAGILAFEPYTHSKKTSPTNFSDWNIVEIACRLPDGTKVACGNSTLSRALRKLRYFTWNGENNVTDMSYMFRYCYSLTAIPELDTSSVTDMSYMFNGCNSLTAIPELDTSSVTNMSYMFNDCNSLTAIPELDTSSVTNMSNMFNGCNSLTAIPELDTSSVTNMNYMFGSCITLTAIPELDTSSVTNMGGMFSGCRVLTAIPELDTSSVTNMSSMFSNCNSLAAVPELDTSSVTSMSGMFNGCNSLARLLLDPTVSGWSGYEISLSGCSLGHEAIVDLFNSLPTITSSKVITLTGNPGVSELTTEERQIAIGKMWTPTP